MIALLCRPFIWNITLLVLILGGITGIFITIESCLIHKICFDKGEGIVSIHYISLAISLLISHFLVGSIPKDYLLVYVNTLKGKLVT